jgi:hypothetical protein
MEYKILCKCQCGGNIIILNKLYKCCSCETILWKYSFGREFKDNEVKKLIKGETVLLKGLKSSNNTLYDTKAYLKDKTLKLLMDEYIKPTTMFKCNCGGDVVKINGGFKCESCEQIIWNKFMNKLLTFAQIKRLFKGDSLTLNNLKSSRGNIFNAEIFYNNKELSLEYL